MKIGVIGGGQLGRMLALAGTPLGMNFAFLDPAPDACAASWASTHPRRLRRPGAPAATGRRGRPGDLRVRERAGGNRGLPLPVRAGLPERRVAAHRPRPLVREVNVQGPRHSHSGLRRRPVPGRPRCRRSRHRPAGGAQDPHPGLRRQGQKVLRQPADVQGAFAELGSVPCILEGFVPFTGEVSLVAVRARDGETRFYPLVHNTHDSGIPQTLRGQQRASVAGAGRGPRRPRAGTARLRRRAGLRVLRGGRRPEGQRDRPARAQLRALDHRRRRVQPVREPPARRRRPAAGL